MGLTYLGSKCWLMMIRDSIRKKRVKKKRFVKKKKIVSEIKNFSLYLRNDD